MEKQLYSNQAWRKAKRNYISGMMQHQNDMLDHMLENDLLTIALPTGTGKSRIIYGDIMEHIQESPFDVFAIASHRLLLGSQHISDLIQVFKYALGHISFIFIGSGGFDFTEVAKDPEFNSVLAEFNVNYNDLIFSSSSNKEIVERVNYLKGIKKDVIVISTYHSLNKLRNIDVHTVYCDEAHMLATPEELGQFKVNFEAVAAMRKYFFTATPKDGLETETDLFLMNNVDVFGERKELSFKEAVERGLIVKPYIHIIQPTGYMRSSNYASTENYAKIIKSGYAAHFTKVKELSAHPENINAKMLVKCPSVQDIWNIRDFLTTDSYFDDITIACGACYGAAGENFSYTINGLGMGKLQFLKELKSFKSTDKVIILHYDTLSEGIDVPGITGVMFLSSHVPTRAKILQTIGRSTRLHVSDRAALSNKEFGITDKEKWTKPYCAVMLPYIDIETENSVYEIAKIIKEMIMYFDFDPRIFATSGDDTGVGVPENAVEGINEVGYSKPLFDLIDNVIHQIQHIDAEFMDAEEEKQTIEIFAKKENTEYVNELIGFMNEK